MWCKTQVLPSFRKIYSFLFQSLILTIFIIENIHVVVEVKTRRINIRYNHSINELVGCWYFLNLAHHFTRVLWKHACTHTHIKQEINLIEKKE